MRYTRSLRKLLQTGSRNLIDTELRKRIQPGSLAATDPPT